MRKMAEIKLKFIKQPIRMGIFFCFWRAATSWMYIRAGTSYIENSRITHT